MMGPMFKGKPIIGLAGGIGSGKSAAASIFAELGCHVVNSDEQVGRVYDQPEVRRTLKQWWGEEVVLPDGQINRRLIAWRIFQDPEQRRRLEALIHPRVASLRAREMEQAASKEGLAAFVWDTPLLFESGLNKECDAVVFIDSPTAQRLQRVREKRGWDGLELARREKSQWPLDRKRDLADYVIDNTADLPFLRRQVQNTLSRVLAGLT